MTKVAASYDNKHIVAVTSNNVVRIFFKLWSKLSFGKKLNLQTNY